MFTLINNVYTNKTLIPVQWGLYLLFFRYIQAHFIELKSSQALEKAERECASQLYEAFSATEKLRQEVMRLEDEDLLQSNIAVVKETLNLIDLKIKPILKVRSTQLKSCALITKLRSSR